MSRASSDTTSREQVISLQRALDEQLQERQARESGICPVREQLYSNCFDSLIQQVSLSSNERGALLQRVRNEMQLSIACYQALYAASISFGMRKGMQAEIGRDEHASRLSQLESEKAAAQRALAQQKAVYEQLEKRHNEQRAADEKRQQDEKEFLKYQQQHLEAFLKQAQQ